MYAQRMAVEPRPRVTWAMCCAFLSVLLFVTAGIIPHLGRGARAEASTTPECTISALQVMFIPNDPPQGTKGAIFLQNISAHDCSVSGQPTIRIFNRAGSELNLSESLYHWDPALPRPRSPAVLTSKSSSAIVEWDWCGFASSYKRIDIEFEGWKRPVEILSTSESPDFYSAPACKRASESRIAVDYVRGLGPKGIAGLPQTVRVVPDRDLRNGEKVTVFVSGFWPEAKFWLSECAKVADVRGPPGCGQQLAAEPFGGTDVTGRGMFAFTVQSRAPIKPFGFNKTVPCTDKCVLMATSGPGITWYAPISFAP
jgi:hypothetical protein